MQYPLVIFLSILGAGAIVLIGFATMRFYQSRDGDGIAGDGEYSLPMTEPQASQAVYMREVRSRNQLDIAKLTGHAAPLSYPTPSTGTYGYERSGSGERGYYSHGSGGGTVRGDRPGSAGYYNGTNGSVSGAERSTPALKAWQ